MLLGSKHDGISGRTAVQKLGYFSAVMLNKELGYEADFYGPYSPIIAANLEILVESDFVTETRLITSRNRKMYRYKLTEEAEPLVSELKRTYKQESRIIEGVVGKCDKIVNCDYNVLSWAAKVHFILAKGNKPMTYQEASAACKPFGWKLGKREIGTAAELLQDLKLIEKK
jgi:uncharacterized protein